MLVLGIESTCDETACSVVRNGDEILSNIIASQIDLHNEFGGVVPELACRQHVDVIIPVIRQALKEAGVKLEDVDIIAVANGPGLIGAILIGLNAAKAISFATGKPFVAVNHIEAHLYAAIMGRNVKFPALGIVLSGGHSSLVKISSIGNYKLVGTTVDDAIGEAFDKTAKILDLPYPGGPHIEKLAINGDPTKYKFKAGSVKGHPLCFSFSGLKTAVLYAAKGANANKSSKIKIREEDKKDVAASFQEAAFCDVLNKTKLALSQEAYKSIIIGGGVTNNSKIREMFSDVNLELPIYFPGKKLSTDNAAMIAGLGFVKYKQQGSDSLNIDAKIRMPWV